MTPEELARTLPDTAGWVDIRGLLLSGACTLIDGGAGWLVRSTRSPRIGAVGRPSPDAVRRAVEGGGSDLHLLARPEDAPGLAPALPGWTLTHAALHRLRPGSDRTDRADLAGPTDGVRLLGSGDRALARHLPADLRPEIEDALAYAPTAAVLVEDDGEPRIAAVCYATHVTESLWDVSIDTVEPYRRRGLAVRAVTFLTRHLRERGKEPVWGAQEDNEPSLRLAGKLGYEPVDRLAVFVPPGPS